MTEILDDLSAHNPHYLEMALRCAAGFSDPERIMTGFAIFYRILELDARDRSGAVPRITPDTRDIVSALIGEVGEERFILLATETLRSENPCLLQMAHSFSSRYKDYLAIMQGFLLLYKCLAAQAVTDRMLTLNGRDGFDDPRGLPAPDA
ncbi:MULTISPECIES: hypothetical protein [unclassified Sphingobium]|uniref:hypothetical protein n=1 Tax=unclassified Sphingobium TaxID=2611147 RepID=UPI000B06552C|nr:MULTISPECIES: hypothetical protein [unclassified Sphingobium]